MSCLCADCSPTPSQTYSAAHKLACEARHVAKQSREWRQEFVAAVKKARGEDAAVALLQEVMRQTGSRTL